MIISSQGYDHFTGGINNQDFGVEMPRCVLILDGCSGGKFSEVGAKLFGQFFSRKEECDKVEKFEDNVKQVFEDLICMVVKYYPNRGDLEENYIMENLLFTIIACFETEKEYIVKLFGDGYIFTQNSRDLLSYMKFSYGQAPPYVAYKFCDMSNTGLDFSNANFKTFHFDKKSFKRVGIASDGLFPIAKGNIPKADDFIKEGKITGIKGLIIGNRQMFNDDVTIGMIGGSEHGIL